jgi:hypothetical protein
MPASPFLAGNALPWGSGVRVTAAQSAGLTESAGKPAAGAVQPDPERRAEQPITCDTQHLAAGATASSRAARFTAGPK